MKSERPNPSPEEIKNLSNAEWLEAVKEKHLKRKTPIVQESAQQESEDSAKKDLVKAFENPEEEKRKELVKKVIETGGFYSTMWLSKNVSPSESRGFNSLSSGFIENWNAKPPFQEIERQLGISIDRPGDLTSTRSVLSERGVDELIDIRYEKKPIYKTITIPPKKFLGLFTTEEGYTKKEEIGRESIRHDAIVQNGKPEPAIIFSYILGPTKYYTDTGGRQDVAFNFSVTLPESLSKELKKMLHSDPSVMREIIETSVKEKMFIDNPEHWTNPKIDKNGSGKDMQGSPVRPPFEKLNGRVYIQEEGDESGWHEKNIYTIKNK
jgi:hypothetical protein